EGNGEVRDFPGNYTQYRLWIKEQEKLPVTGSRLQEESKSAGNLPSETGNKKKPSFKEKREFELLEKEIDELEAEKQQIENQLSDSGAPYERLNLLSRRI